MGIFRHSGSPGKIPVLTDDSVKKRFRIRNGHAVDPASGLDGVFDILVADGRIEDILPSEAEVTTGDEDVDASGCYVLPGLVDIHTHLREPGFEYKETIATGTRAAVNGGFTAVCCMPNTRPVNDEPAITRYIQKKADTDGSCGVYPIGAITRGQSGEYLAEMGSLVEAGCVGFSDDGRPVMNSLIMRRALEYSRIFKVPIISHAEDTTLSGKGVMNEGLTAVQLGLRGIPNAAEDIIVARDIALSELTGGRLHVAHVSTEGSVRLIRDAKRRGVNVTAETCPHYFALTEEAALNYNTAAKVNPPLRTRHDVDAVREGLQDGTFDAIVTDHAPHHREEKAAAFDDAPPGISGLETALGLALGLVHDGTITISRLVDLLSINPCRIMNIPARLIRVGAEANLVIVDPRVEWVVDASRFESRGKNTPFEGRLLKGRAVRTVVSGEAFACR